MDTWLSLRNLESNGERNRGLYVLKSRGMSHSNQIREFLLTDHGVELVDVYLGTEGVLTGSARLNQEARERAESAARQEELESQRRRLDRRRTALEAQIACLRAELEGEEEELERQARETMRREERAADEPRGDGLGPPRRHRWYPYSKLRRSRRLERGTPGE